MAKTLAETRQELKELLANRPSVGPATKEEARIRDRLCLYILSLYVFGGMDSTQISKKLKIPKRTVLVYIARGRTLTFDSESREEIRQHIITQLEEQREIALEMDPPNLTEARLCMESIGRFTNLISTGGNTLNVGVNVNSAKVDLAIDKWLEKQDIIEGQVVDDEKRLMGAPPPDPDGVK